MADLYSYTLKAGVPLQASVQGKLIVVDDIQGADGVDITPMLNASNLRTMPARKKAFKAWIDFDAVVLQSDTDCTVSIWLASRDVSLGFADGSLVNVVGGVSILNDQGDRVPVDIGGGTVNVTASNVGINNTNDGAIPVRSQSLSALVHVPALMVNKGAAQALSSDPTLRRLRVRNNHVSAVVGIGGAGVTMTNAAILLQPGDTWAEDDAAGAAWFAVSDTDGADVRVMGVK